MKISVNWGWSGEVEILVPRVCNRGFVHYRTKYVYLVITETVWNSACRLIRCALIFFSIIHIVTIKGHITTAKEIDFYEKYKTKKNPLA